MTDEAAVSRVAAYGLLIVSAVALGATLAAINNRHWSYAIGMALVAWLTGWASGAERQHQRECESVT